MTCGNSVLYVALTSCHKILFFDSLRVLAFSSSSSSSFLAIETVLPVDMHSNGFHQERIKGTERASPIQTLFHSIGNPSRVIFRIGIKLPRALRALRDVSWRFRMTKRRAKHVGRKAMKA